MILSNVVNIKISNNQIKYYTEKGYNVKGGNELKEIRVEDLQNNSGVKIKVKCDYCDNEKEISLNRYMINTKNKTLYYACCQKCMQNKVKKTILEKYGVENISNVVSVKNQKIETCLINYGVEYPQQSDFIFNKGLETKLKKYGDVNYNNSISMIETKLKNLTKKYGAVKYDGKEFTFECKKGHQYNILSGLYYNRIRIIHSKVIFHQMKILSTIL